MSVELCPCCGQVVKPLALTSQVLGAIGDNPLSFQDIARALGYNGSYKKLHNALGALVRGKKMVHVAHDLYRKAS